VLIRRLWTYFFCIFISPPPLVLIYLGDSCETKKKKVCPGWTRHKLRPTHSSSLAAVLSLFFD
jgi:hypothetical protein